MGEGKLYKYSIVNESGVPVVLKAYIQDAPAVEPGVIYLKVNDTLSKIYQNGLPPSTYSFRDFFGDRMNSKDSLHIIYNESKISVFVTEFTENKSNPLNVKIYDDVKEKFVITKEAFENATPCEGTCD